MHECMCLEVQTYAVSCVAWRTGDSVFIHWVMVVYAESASLCFSVSCVRVLLLHEGTFVALYLLWLDA